MTKGVQKTVTGLLIAALCAGSLAGAPDKAEAKKKATIKKKSLTIVKGKSKKITIKNKNKKYRYTFTSNKKKVAKVSKAGKVKGIKVGSAKITVKEIAGKGKKRNMGKVKVKVINKDTTKASNTPATTPNQSSPSNSTATPTPPSTVTTTPPSTATDTPTATATPTPTPTSTTVVDNPAVAANPLIYSDVPDVDYIRVGEDYYMVSTTMFLNPGIPVMHSKDLVHWEIISYVYDTLEDNDTTNLMNGNQCYGKGSWAASLRYNEVDKLYYVCFSSNDQGKVYIYTTDDIKSGNWKKHSANGIKHDPGLLFADGKSYIFSGNGNIAMQEFELTEDGIKFGSSKTVLKKSSSKNIVSIEGCHAYKIGDYYYLFFISWPNGDQRTEWCYRTTSLTGEWEECRVFHNGGIAQGGIIETQNGDWYAMLFKDSGSVGRIPVLLEVYWEDGWPMMGTNGKKDSAKQIEVKLESSGQNYIWADDTFDYDENKLQLVWQWNHNPDNDNWSVTERKGYLRLRTGSLANSIVNARNSLTQRTFGKKCTSEASIDVNNMKDGDYAGICAFQNSYGQVGVMKEDGKTYIYYGAGKWTDGNDVVDTMTIADSDKIALEQSQVYLKINYNFTSNTSTYQYSLDGATWNDIGGKLSMDYNLKVFMGYRTYLYNYATKETGGYVDFDYYKIYE